MMTENPWTVAGGSQLKVYRRQQKVPCKYCRVGTLETTHLEQSGS